MHQVIMPKIGVALFPTLMYIWLLIKIYRDTDYTGITQLIDTTGASFLYVAFLLMVFLLPWT
jgi:hypothetical protein